MITVHSTRNFSYVLLLLCAAGILFTPQTHSQSPSVSESQLESVEVTAPNILAVRQQTLPQTILDRGAIQKSQATDMQELLKYSLGVQFAQSGGRGSITSLFLRGTASDQVLVLVDGIRINSLSSGDTPWNTILPENAESIRILRGARSVTYGSEAIGGIIEIRTRCCENIEEHSTRPHLYYRLGLGSRGSFNNSIHISGNSPNGRLDGITYQLGIAYSDTEGIDHRTGSATDADDDGFRRRSVSLSLSRPLDEEGSSLRLSLIDNESEAEYDEFRLCGQSATCSDDVYGIENVQLINLSGRHQHAQSHSHWSLARSRNEYQAFDSFANFFDTERLSFNWRNERTVSGSGNGSLIFGIEYYRDELESETGYAEESRGNTAAFVERQFDWKTQWLDVAVRYDDNEQFGDHTVYSIDWGVAINSNLSAIVSGATSFNAPTFNDLYFPGFSNPNLGPEEATNIEVGLVYRLPRQSLATYLYRNRLDNEIVYDSVSMRPENIRQSTIRGLEVEWQLQGEDWQFSANANILEPVNDETGELALRRARRTVNLDWSHHYDRWSWGFNMRAQSRRYDFGGVRLGGYGLVSLQLERELFPGWKLQLKLDNLLDKKYATVEGYRQEGFSTWFNLLFDFE